MKGSFAKFLDPSRSLQAKLAVQDIRLRFASNAMPALANVTCHDAGFNGSTIIQVAIAGGIMYQHNITGFPNWNASAAWASGNAADTLAITDDAKHVVYSRGTSVYRRTFTGVVAGTEYLLYTSPTPTFSLAITYHPLDATKIIVVAFETVNASTDGWFVGSVVQRVYNASWVLQGTYTWNGFLSMDAITPPVLDAVGGLIFFTDHSGKRTLWLNQIPENASSDTGSVLVLEITDDTAFFKLNSAAKGLDGLIYLSGISSRQNSRPMTIYTACSTTIKTEAEFTFGRDMFIKSNNTDTDTEGLGNLLFTPQGAFYLGPDKLYVANNGTTIQSPFVTGTGTAINSLSTASVSCSPNQPFGLTAQIASSDVGTNGLAAGSIVSLSAGANGDPLEQIYLFGADQIEASSTQTGKDAVIRGSSLAMKKLTEWTSDSAFDYWSQSKVYVNAKDMTGLVRVSGQWDEMTTPDAGLTLKDLNKDGILYTVERASDGCSARIRFMRHSFNPTPGPGEYDAQVGLIVNYQKETLAQAAARLNIDVSKVTDEQCGRTGIFAVQSQVTSSSGGLVPVVNVYLYNSLNTDGQFYNLAIFNLDIPLDTWAWMMVTYREGQVNVYYGTENIYTKVTNWTLVGTVLAYPGWMYGTPLDKDTNGRAGVYVKINTPNSVSYPFASDSTVVPVFSNFLFPNADSVQVDDEIIAYTGKSGTDRVEGLNFKYGREIVAQANGALTYPYNWQFDRHTNAIKQTFSLSGTQYIRGVFVKIGKVGYPEDGLELRIYGGTEDVNVSAFGDLKASATVDVSQILDVSQITATNGWVFFSFYDKVQVVNGDRIWLTRSQNGSFPNSNSYFVTWLTPNVAGMKFYRWGNDDFIAHNRGYFEQNNLGQDISNPWDGSHGGNSCAMPFRLIAYNDQPGGMGAVCVQTDVNLAQTADFYNNYALIVTEGSGIGSVYKITGYKYAADVCFIYVEKSPGFGFDETTKLSIVQSLYNLTRPDPASHGASIASTYRAEPIILLDKFGYFSKDLDRSLYNYVNTISAKAGVLNMSGEMAYPSLINTGMGIGLNRRNLIFRTCPLVTATKSATYLFRMPVDQQTNISLTITPTAMTYTGSDGGSEVFPFAYNPSFPTLNWLTISLYDRYISVWMGNRQIHTFVLSDADVALTGDLFSVSGTAFNPIDVYMEVPEACVRIDNYVLDIGKTGLSMIDEIVGNKRFYFQDDQNGGLYLFRNRQDVNNQVSPYALATDFTETKSDAGKITRVLLEGGLVVERFDPSEMVDHGNLFARMNIFEIMNDDDAKFFAEKILYELSTMDIQVKMAGAAWPKLDPEDMFWVQVDSGLKHVIIDTIALNFAASENDATSEMEITGRSI